MMQNNKFYKIFEFKWQYYKVLKIARRNTFLASEPEFKSLEPISRYNYVEKNFFWYCIIYEKQIGYVLYKDFDSPNFNDENIEPLNFINFYKLKLESEYTGEDKIVLNKEMRIIIQKRKKEYEIFYTFKMSIKSKILKILDIVFDFVLIKWKIINPKLEKLEKFKAWVIKDIKIFVKEIQIELNDIWKNKNVWKDEIKSALKEISLKMLKKIKEISLKMLKKIKKRFDDDD